MRPSVAKKDGGADSDFVGSYGKGGPVVVDLSRTDGQGRANENDSFSGIEGVSGTPGADVLLGTDAIDVLDGEGGNDEIKGFGGDDVLTAGNGVVEGGPGDDRLVYPVRYEDGWSEPRFICGAGDDVVAQENPSFFAPRKAPSEGSAGPLLEPDCEELHFPGRRRGHIRVDPLPVRTTRSGKLTFRLLSRLGKRHTLALSRLPSPFERLDKRPAAHPRTVLSLPGTVVDEWRTSPLEVRLKLASSRTWIPRVWRFSLTTPE